MDIFLCSGLRLVKGNSSLLSSWDLLECKEKLLLTTLLPWLEKKVRHIALRPSNLNCMTQISSSTIDEKSSLNIRYKVIFQYFHSFISWGPIFKLMFHFYCYSLGSPQVLKTSNILKFNTKFSTVILKFLIAGHF